MDATKAVQPEVAPEEPLMPQTQKMHWRGREEKAVRPQDCL